MHQFSIQRTREKAKNHESGIFTHYYAIIGAGILLFISRNFFQNINTGYKKAQGIWLHAVSS